MHPKLSQRKTKQQKITWLLLFCFFLSLLPMNIVAGEGDNPAGQTRGPISLEQLNKWKKEIEEKKKEQERQRAARLGGGDRELANKEKKFWKSYATTFVTDLITEPKYLLTVAVIGAGNWLLTHVLFRLQRLKWGNLFTEVKEFEQGLSAETKALLEAEKAYKLSLIKNFGTLSPEEWKKLLDKLPMETKAELAGKAGQLDAMKRGTAALDDLVKTNKITKAEADALKNAMGLTEASTQYMKAYEAWRVKYLDLMRSGTVRGAIKSAYGAEAWGAIDDLIKGGKGPMSLEQTLATAEKALATASTAEQAAALSKEAQALRAELAALRAEAGGARGLTPRGLKWARIGAWAAIIGIPLVVYGVNKHSNDRAKEDLQEENARRADTAAEENMNRYAGILMARHFRNTLWNLWTRHKQLKHIPTEPLFGPPKTHEAQDADLLLFQTVILLATTEMAEEDKGNAIQPDEEKELIRDDRVWRKVIRIIFQLGISSEMENAALQSLSWDPVPLRGDERFDEEARKNRAKSISELIDELYPIAARAEIDWAKLLDEERKRQKEQEKKKKEEEKKENEAEATGPDRNPLDLAEGGNDSTNAEGPVQVEADKTLKLKIADLKPALDNIVVLTLDNDSDKYSKLTELGANAPVLIQIQNLVNELEAKSFSYDVGFIDPTKVTPELASSWAKKMRDSKNPVYLGSPFLRQDDVFLKMLKLGNLRGAAQIKVTSTALSRRGVVIKEEVERGKIERENGWLHPESKVEQFDYQLVLDRETLLAYEIAKQEGFEIKELQRVRFKAFSEAGITKIKIADLLAKDSRVDRAKLKGKHLFLGSDHDKFDAFSSVNGDQFNGVFAHALGLAALLTFKDSKAAGKDTKKMILIEANPAPKAAEKPMAQGPAPTKPQAREQK